MDLTEMKTLNGLLRDIKEEAYQEMCSLLGQWKEEIVIILVSSDCESAIGVVPFFQLYNTD